MPSELFRRAMSGLIGLVFGLVPLIYALIKKLPLPGAVSAVLCVVLGAVGFPDFTPILAAVCFGAVYKINQKKVEKQTEENNKRYRQKMREQQEAGREAMIGTIENRRTANASWPPVNQVIDPKALQEFEKMMQEDSEGGSDKE